MAQIDSVTPPAADSRSPLVSVGEHVTRKVSYTRDEIARFAALTLDPNPVHRDPAAARRAGHADVIASGQQTSALLSGLAAAHFSRDDDGVAREMLCLNFNFAYRAPVFAGSELTLEWRVSGTEWNASLGGVIAQLDGGAQVAGSTAVVARGTVLVRHAP
jgi:acyl dehydratase